MVDRHSEELRKDLVKIEVKLIKSEIRFLKFMLKNARYQQNSMLKEIIRQSQAYSNLQFREQGEFYYDINSIQNQPVLMQIEDYIKAGKIAGEVRENVRKKDWIGSTLAEICEYV